jgi:TetR/AcrR family acrAB operon transcriptional repressor
MVRRTKADAEATRNRLLDAAEQLFQARGVSGTSLNDIAVAAGTTRGAIYWHFKDKADLFNAMMERVTLPLEETLKGIGKKASSFDGPLQPLRDAIAHTLHKAATDEQTRRVFEIATLQVEYNDEMHSVRARHLQCRNDCVLQTAKVLRAAADHQGLTLAVPLQCAALGLHVMVDGLILNWLLDNQAFDLQLCGHQVVDTYLSGLGFSQPGVRAPRRPAPKPATAASDAAPPAPAGLPKPAPSQKQTA